MRHSLTCLMTVVTAIALVGCGSDGDGDGGGANGLAAILLLQQQQQVDANVVVAQGQDRADIIMSAQALAGVDVAIGGAVSGLVSEANSNGATAMLGSGGLGALGLPMKARLEVGPPSGLAFEQTSSFLLDFDAMVGGEDPYPQLSGLVTASSTAIGEISGGATDLLGRVNYQTIILTLNDIVATSDEGARGVWPANTIFELDTHINWAWTNLANWGYNVVWTLSRNDMPITFVPEIGVTWTGTVSMNLEGEGQVWVIAGDPTVSSSLTGTRTVVWTNDSEQEVSVVWSYEGDQVSLSVNGEVYGPYSRDQLQRLYGLSLSL